MPPPPDLAPGSLLTLPLVKFPRGRLPRRAEDDHHGDLHGYLHDSEAVESDQMKLLDAWRKRARKALDNWSPSSEIAVAEQELESYDLSPGKVAELVDAQRGVRGSSPA